MHWGACAAALAKAGVSAGAIAQLGERLLCKQEVVGSIPSGSTKFCGEDRCVWRAAIEAERGAPLW